MRVLQARATLSSHRPHTPNEIRSAVRVRSSALYLPLDKPNTRNKSIAGRRARASIHHPYITEAGVKMIHNLLASLFLLRGMRRPPSSRR